MSSSTASAALPLAGHSSPSLSLPPSQFARLQPHAYLHAHLSPPPSTQQSPIRANGRAPLEFRPTSANLGSLTHTNGSAVVRIGDTAAVCGVRAEILHTEDIASWGVSTSSSSRKRRRINSGDNEDSNTAKNGEDEDDDDDYIQDLSLLVPNLSLSTGCAPGFTPSAPPSALAQALSHQLLNMLHTSRLVRSKDLQILYQPPDLDAMGRGQSGQDDDAMETETEAVERSDGESEVKGFWVLYIDVMMISLAGNPFDAAWASVVAALRDTRLPKAWWDIDNDMVLCSDKVAESRKLNLRGCPVSCTYFVFDADAAADWRAVTIPEADDNGNIKTTHQQESWILADPDGYEEGLCKERIYFVVDKEEGSSKTKIISMEKNGGWSVSRDDLKKLLEISTQRWKEVKNILEGLQ